MIEISKAVSSIYVAKVSDFDINELVDLLGDDEKQRLEKIIGKSRNQNYYCPNDGHSRCFNRK